ncbi:type II secretion system protein [Mesoaciditoga lauensis]|uniref:type II secretion system protein n=1 Tax=Mesoaciditoga lauensis TaxID=1495039 RepID=UPI00055F2141|nr:type II secretion system protein [Mesoaciditoga lauensis]
MKGKKGFTYIELLVAIAVTGVLLTLLSMMVYDLTQKTELAIHRMNAISEANLVNSILVQNLEKAEPEGEEELKMLGNSVRYKVVVPLVKTYFTNQITFSSTEIFLYSKPYTQSDFSGEPYFTYQSQISMPASATVNFISLSLGKLKYNIKVKAPLSPVESTFTIALLNLQ